MNIDTNISQLELVKEFYARHPNREIKHEEAVKWLTSEYNIRTGKTFADPDRAIRKLFQTGFLIKVKKGVYKYDPAFVQDRFLQDFTSIQKEEIFKRDGYRCVICGLGRENGLEIHADHIKPKDLGGKAEIYNGQTLCSIHNFRKKNYGQTETGKKMFIRLYDAAKEIDDEKTKKFCEAVLETFEYFGINGHINWKP